MFWSKLFRGWVVFVYIVKSDVMVCGDFNSHVFTFPDGLCCLAWQTFIRFMFILSIAVVCQTIMVHALMGTSTTKDVNVCMKNVNDVILFTRTSGWQMRFHYAPLNKNFQAQMFQNYTCMWTLYLSDVVYCVVFLVCSRHAFSKL